MRARAHAVILSRGEAKDLAQAADESSERPESMVILTQ